MELYVIFYSFEEIHNLYALPNIITAIKSRTTGRAEHVARLGEMRTT